MLSLLEKLRRNLRTCLIFLCDARLENGLLIFTYTKKYRHYLLDTVFNQFFIFDKSNFIYLRNKQFVPTFKHKFPNFTQRLTILRIITNNLFVIKKLTKLQKK